jgi:hypothetical protein
VRPVAEVELIATLPLTTFPPVGRDCANDGCAQPKPHNSAIKLTEVRNFQAQDLMADERYAVDETIIEKLSLPFATLQTARLDKFFVGCAMVLCTRHNVALSLSKRVLNNARNLADN